MSDPEPEGIDLAAIRNVIETADVFVVRFALVEHRLMVDFRPDAEGHVYIKIVPPVSSPEERYRFLQRERPGLAPPDQITVFQWPRSISVLRDSGLWAVIEERLASIVGEPARQQATAAYKEGRRLERADTAALIRGGEGYETIWERQR
ncbi:MAG: hypothetical protein KC461_07175 [Dehalococcoidia bacterium]|nr:hypothetical protein [Dehalococcoidia bacterium]MCA9850409.1 hypothetical protein [Dehalococcoidia bacterium]MCB9484351.1 hypothetical protein [Dehalococcoidia bacterium]MCB9490721.1 hypothetical protein [Dehalococcoidia bacterium]